MFEHINRSKNCRLF